MTAGALAAAPLAVRRVRYRTTRPGPTGLRARDALDRLDHDTGLPRSAVLVVRRLRGVSSGEPPAVTGIDLRAVAVGAHRPSAGPPPPGCEAVVFADDAELLACLCRDVAGVGVLAWWWTTVFGRGGAGGAPLEPRPAASAAFARLPHAIPAAAAAAPAAVVAAACGLARPELLAAMAAMVEAHAAPELGEVVRRSWHRPAAPRRSGPAGGTVGRSTEGAAGQPDPPDRAVAPLAAALVDTARLLHRDPATARSAAWARALQRRLDAPAVPAGAVARTARIDDGRWPARSPDPGVLELRVAEPWGTAGGVAAPALVDAVDTVPNLAGAEPPGGGSAVDAPEAAPPAGGEAAAHERVATAHAGAFYLLHLLDRLDLPDSASGPGEPGPLLTRWGVLALVLRAWPGIDPDDPLQAALDDLAWPDDVDPTDPHPDQPWTFRSPAASGGPSPVGPSFSGAVLSDGTTGAGRWGARVALVLVESLAELGLQPGIVHVPATVEAGTYSVRAHLALDDVDIDVRRAGLDRDPGWVPSLGRVVELRFT